mmetsp:Transcript_27981/g.50949  ORF Transcript_27981/g.50949 Transcript_27981/m.50949 type:complete len:515 (-) Transcript_27981:601-2145(-)
MPDLSTSTLLEEATPQNEFEDEDDERTIKHKNGGTTTRRRNQRRIPVVGKGVARVGGGGRLVNKRSRPSSLYAVEEEKKDELGATDLIMSTSRDSTSTAALSPSADEAEKCDNIDDDVSSAKKADEFVAAPQAHPSKGNEEQAVLILPYVSFSSGIAHKASAKKLSSWVSMSLTLDGRDKITKFMQYACRLLAWFYNGSNSNNLFLAMRFRALYKALSESRKAFRLGRTITECTKIAEMNWGQFLLNSLVPSHVDDTDATPTYTPRPKLPRRVSSNIGFKPESSDDLGSTVISRSLRGSLIRKLSGLTQWIQKDTESPQKNDAPTWKLVGSTLKMLGLAGFWAGDNISFIAGTGFLDNYRLESAQARAQGRGDLKQRATHFGMRSYFIGSLAGLYVNARSYWTYRTEDLEQAYARLHSLEQKNETAESETDDTLGAKLQEARNSVEKARLKQFQLWLALLKSCCDIICFSNNPGVDLHLKYRGKKMNDGVHSVCGLICASTVLYNNFPNAKSRN